MTFFRGSRKKSHPLTKPERSEPANQPKSPMRLWAPTLRQMRPPIPRRGSQRLPPRSPRPLSQPHRRGPWGPSQPHRRGPRRRKRSMCLPLPRNLPKSQSRLVRNPSPLLRSFLQNVKQPNVSHHLRSLKLLLPNIYQISFLYLNFISKKLTNVFIFKHLLLDFQFLPWRKPLPSQLPPNSRRTKMMNRHWRRKGSRCTRDTSKELSSWKKCSTMKCKCNKSLELVLHISILNLINLCS